MATLVYSAKPAPVKSAQQRLRNYQPLSQTMGVIKHRQQERARVRLDGMSVVMDIYMAWALKKNRIRYGTPPGEGLYFSVTRIPKKSSI